MRSQTSAFRVRFRTAGRRWSSKAIEKGRRKTVQAKNFLVGKEKQATESVDADEVGDVEQLLGVREVELEDGQTVVEYLVSWKDDFPDLW